jgi:RNA polymerase sigma-B factor
VTLAFERLDRKHVRELFADFARTRSADTRERLALAHTGVVRYLATRFAGRGETLEDLMQVGMIGLLKAIDRFDPGHGVEFVTFAFPTITGEIKRHFRDRCWTVHVPRRLQTLNQAVTRVAEFLTMELGRSPTVDDIAERLDVTAESVLEAQELGNAYAPISLDATLEHAQNDRRDLSLVERAGSHDPTFAALRNRSALKDACRCLDPNERLIIYLRFYEEVPQTEIARRLNVSQMKVSRLQRRALEKIRQAFFTDEDQLAM